MTKLINIAVVGLGQVGNYLLNELNIKKKDIEIKNNQKKLNQILKKSDDITSMTLEEYEIYIDDYTKKSKYPDISK